jgi:hypothetical protein
MTDSKKIPPPSGALGVLCVCALLFGSSGCALHLRDKTGRTHVVGFICETRPTLDSRAALTTTETSRNVGVMLYASPSHRGVSIGYNAVSITLATAPAAVKFTAPHATASLEHE